MNDPGVKQQIVDIIQNSDTILVTVSTNPTVDQLAAALGLTLYFNDIGKHATAVVSGEIPPAIKFLEPEKTLEPTVDSLRDFVIALDKEKADHLRYKVEGDVVKIFITPYKTVISDKDLDFSQGDYNVETVVVLGVSSQEHLDKALSAHGKIFHDANVVTIGLEPSALGTLDWADERSSSLSELAASLTSDLQTEEHPRSSQVASALLTGIVSATDRFSNEKTSARTMSLAGDLMASGANQQLIAAKLREGAKLPMDEDGAGTKKQLQQRQKTPDTTKSTTGSSKRRDKGLSIAHEKTDATSGSKETQEATAEPASADPKATLDAALNKANANREVAAQQELDSLVKDIEQTAASAPKTPEDELSEQLAVVAPPAPSAAVALEEIAAAPEVSDATSTDATPDFIESDIPATPVAESNQPDAAEPTDPAKTIVPHAGEYVGDTTPPPMPPINGAGQDGSVPSIDPFANISAPAATSTDTLADIDKRTRGLDVQPPSEAAMQAVNAVIEAAPDPKPFEPLAAIENAPPAPVPQQSTETIAPGVGAPMTPPPPPMPDFTQLPPLPPLPQSGIPPVVAPAPVTPLEPQPPQPPVIDAPQAPLPPEQLGSVLPQAPDAPVATGSTDPKQFKIPGQ